MSHGFHSSAFDERMMAYALRLAERGMGRTWPNPTVGCVITKHGKVIAAARTADGGRPHAETEALKMAGSEAQDATVYVTLEPCAHYGTTPPCAQALIDAKVARVVIACLDTDGRVAGKGMAMLEEAGIEMEIQLLEEHAQQQHAGFFHRVQHGLPLLDMKIATSLDGKIANAAGESQWITGEEARNHAHGLRARYDAILTGIGTVLADDPALTCRLPALEHYSPLRVVFDSHLRLPASSQLAQTAQETPVWVLTTSADATKAAALETLGVKVVQLEAADGKVAVEAALRWLAAQGITRVLAEGGAALSGSLWQSGFLRKIYWFRAPIALGDAGTDALTAHISTPPSDLPRLEREDVIALGSDVLEIYNTQQ